MSVNREFREALRNGDLLIGTMLTLPCPSVAEVLSAHFDWLFVDGEHGPLEVPEVLAIVQAVGHRVPCLVRVASGSEAEIKRMLDLGVAGIIVPQVNSAEQARSVVRAAKYAPEGGRGVGLARAHGYGARFAEYVEGANNETTVVVQTEHIEAVDRIAQITDVDGIDAVLIGPYDLSASMNKMGQVRDPEVLSAIERVTAECRAKSIALGYFGVTAEAVRDYVKAGYRLITLGVDTLMLSQAANGLRQSLEETSEECDQD